MCSPPLGCRPLTRLPQSWASLSSCPHVWPIFLTSASRFCCHVFLGWPLFLFPCGFHLRACLVMFVAGLCSLWPIHLQRHCWISASTSFCFVCCHSSSLLILSGHCMWRIHLRQLLMNVWILLVVVMVFLHISAP